MSQTLRGIPIDYKTLRDEIAIDAMDAMLADRGDEAHIYSSTEAWAKSIASRSYLLANAMMEERQNVLEKLAHELAWEFKNKPNPVPQPSDGPGRKEWRWPWQKS